MGKLKANTFIKPSPIHGLGLFAKVDIAKGEKIVQGLADFDTYRDEWIVYVKKWKIKSFAHNNGYCMINHSKTPNTLRGKQMEIIASKNIKAGKEITEDYYKLPDDQNPFIGINLEKLLFYSKNNKNSKKLKEFFKDKI